MCWKHTYIQKKRRKKKAIKKYTHARHTRYTVIFCNSVYYIAYPILSWFFFRGGRGIYFWWKKVVFIGVRTLLNAYFLLVKRTRPNFCERYRRDFIFYFFLSNSNLRRYGKYTRQTNGTITITMRKIRQKSKCVPIFRNCIIIWHLHIILETNKKILCLEI